MKPKSIIILVLSIMIGFIILEASNNPTCDQFGWTQHYFTGWDFWRGVRCLVAILCLFPATQIWKNFWGTADGSSSWLDVWLWVGILGILIFIFSCLPQEKPWEPDPEPEYIPTAEDQKIHDEIVKKHTPKQSYVYYDEVIDSNGVISKNPNMQ